MSTLLREGEFFHTGALVCASWELRITQRCLVEDLGRRGEASFEDVAGEPIVQAFMRERRSKTTGTRNVEPLSHRREVSVIGQGHEHRGGTWFDRKHHVIWLVAYRRHRSGEQDDFYPWCKRLDEEDRLLPTEDDYQRLFDAQGDRFAKSLLIEIPLLLKQAAQSEAEVSAVVGGQFGVAVAIETAEGLQSITMAFDVSTVEVYEYIPAILAATRPGAEWEDADAMPSRELSEAEKAFRWTGEGLNP